MAQSFAHKWGQIIGHLIELTLRDLLEEIATKHKLFLDYHRDRAARPGRKVSWKDRYGNTHDLDYVLERGGTENSLGLPVAFIEMAWRRYTKHSKNKAQEIESAITPLCQTYNHLHPFMGIVLAGEFTQGSVNQLRSKGFSVLHIKYKNVIDAFAFADIDASFNEHTPEQVFKDKIKKWAKLSRKDIYNISFKLIETENDEIDRFFGELVKSLSRQIMSVTIIILHGTPFNINSIRKAIDYINDYGPNQKDFSEILKYEVDVKYNNGDIIHAIFQNKSEAVRFLKTFE